MKLKTIYEELTMKKIWEKLNKNVENRKIELEENNPVMNKEMSSKKKKEKKKKRRIKELWGTV